MSVNDNIRNALERYGGFSINERVFNYLGSLGYTGTISDRLAKFEYNGKIGWQALIAQYGLGDPLRALIDTLYGNGEQGAMYIPQPQVLGQQVLYQDAAGTTVVTADGQTAERMANLVTTTVGDAVKLASNTAPVYSGQALVFTASGTDSQNDTLRLENSAGTYSQGYFFAMVVRRDHLASGIPNLWQRFFAAEDDAQAFYIRDQDDKLYIKDTNNTGVEDRVNVPLDSYAVPDRYYVMTARADLTGVEIRINGHVVARKDKTLSSFTATADLLIANLEAGGLDGRIAGVVYRAGTVTNTQAQLAEQYLAQLKGVDLFPEALAAFRNVAHRGDSDNAPENTIPAYSTAAITDPQKFDGWVECDIRKTSDGVWVLMHDATVDRTTDGSGSVSSLTLAQIKALDAGSWKGAEFAGTQVPTFLEFLQHCQANGLKAYVETKQAASVADMQDILDDVDATIGRSNFVLQSFNWGDLDNLRSLDSTVEVGLLGDITSGNLDTALTYGNAFMFAGTGNLSASNMQLAHEKGVPIDFYTPNTVKQKLRAVLYGARGLTSNSFLPLYAEPQDLPELTGDVVGVALVDNTVQGGSFVWIDEQGNEVVKPDQAWFDAHPAFSFSDETIDGQAMVRVPKSYWKRDQISVGVYGTCDCWWVSPTAKTGFQVFKAFELGGSEVGQFWYGKYEGHVTAGKLCSLPAVTPTANRSWTQFQTDAEARNVSGVTGFCMHHMDMRSVIQWLYLIEVGSFDSQTATARGNADSGTTYATDHPDNLAASYRGIVALWGNVSEWIDGLRHVSGDIQRRGYGQGSWSSTGETRATDAPTYANSIRTASSVADLFITDTSNASASGALVPDYQRWYSSGEVITHVGGYRLYGDVAGLWYMNVYSSATYTTANVGSRLARVV